MKTKVIAIVGPTASGKTVLAIKLATKFSGEIVSADSRAIYRGLDIGTAKPTPAERKLVPHHLLDIVNVGERFTVADFKKLADKAIQNITRRGKVPFLVGGTGLYIDAVLQNFQFPPEADPELRYHLDQESHERLLEILQTIDAETFNIIDRGNPRRVLRAVEVALSTGESFQRFRQKSPVLYQSLVLGVQLSRKKLYERIDHRFEEWVDQGLLDEVRWVLNETSAEWVASLGLHYKWVAAYLTGAVSKQDTFTKSKSALHAFARRQLTWFKRNKNIHWVESDQEAERLVKKFL